MKGLQTIVITMGVMIILATTALVVLVVKKSSRGTNDLAAAGQNTPVAIQGNYITSYRVGDNLAVVLTNAKGQKIINLYDGKNLRLLSTLVIDKQ